MEESDLRQRVWSPLYCHYTNRPSSEDTRKPRIFKTKAPSGAFVLLLDLFVLGLLFTPLTVLFELNFASDKLLVLAAPVVDALAGTAGEFYEFILGHMPQYNSMCRPKRQGYRTIRGRSGLMRVTAS